MRYLKGNFDSQTDAWLRWRNFFNAAERPQEAKPVLHMMTFEHYKEFCKKQDEQKESSPSGLHYGHARTTLFDERLLRIRYKIIELSYKNRVFLSRWTTLWEALIPKKKRSFIHKFCNITLVEGDLQYLMKAIWSQALMRAITPILNSCQNAVSGTVTQSSILGHRVALNTVFVNGEDCIII